MAYARVSYTGDGSTTIFTVPFPYLAASYVEVRVAGTLKSVTTHYTWLTSSTIQFLVAPTNGVTIFILRNTPKDIRLVNYQDAAILREADLDLDSDQAFHITQEVLDATVNSRAVATFVGGVDYTAGVTTTLAIGDTSVVEETLNVLFDAAAQQQTEFSILAGVITFTSAIPVGVLQVQVTYAVPLAVGLIDGSVTTPKLSDLSVTEPKLADLVFDGLTAVAASTSDYVAIADTSSANGKRKTLVSSILALVATASTSVSGLVRLLTTVELQTGTDTTKAATAAAILASLGYSKYVVTAQQTITLGGLLALAHGISRTPLEYEMYLVNTTGEGGYVPGQETRHTGTGASAVGLTVDGMNIYVRFGSSAPVVTRIDTGAALTINTASWKAVFKLKG